MMRIYQVIFVVAVMAASLTAQNKNTPPKKSKSSKEASSTATARKIAPKKVEPVTIPKDAKEIQPGVFRHVDSKGQAWIYSRTPFGIMRGPESESMRQPEPIPTDWKVTDLGDNLEFERPWPFGGIKKWTKAKNDLTEVEAEVWKRAQAGKS